MAFSPLFSCTYGDNPGEIGRTAEFSIGYTLMQSGSMTRSAESVYNDFYTNYMLTKVVAPETYSLQFDGNKMSVVDGRWDDSSMVTMLAGTYTVTGTSGPSGRVGDRMYLIFNEKVKIEPNTTSIVFNPAYDCSLVIFKKSDFASARCEYRPSPSYATDKTQFAEIGDYLYLFISEPSYESGGWGTMPLHIYAKKPSGEEIEFNAHELGFKKGYYYVFDTITNSFNVPEMRRGVLD